MGKLFVCGKIPLGQELIFVGLEKSFVDSKEKPFERRIEDEQEIIIGFLKDRNREQSI